MRRILITNETDLSAGDVLRRISTACEFTGAEALGQQDFFVTMLHDCKVTRELSNAGNLLVRLTPREER